MWQGHQRDGRLGTARPNDQREDRGDIRWNRSRETYVPLGKTAKVSGKVAPFFLFLKQEGRVQFRNIYNVSFDPENKEHKTKMSALYTDERKHKYTRLADEHNRDPVKVSQRKHAIKSKRRELQHNNPIEFHDRQREHQRNIRENRVVNEVSLPLKHRDIYIDEEQAVYVKKNRTSAGMCFNMFLNGRDAAPVNPILLETYTLQVITVLPLIYSYRPQIKKVITSPAEICITTFHLRTGVKETQSIFVASDPSWVSCENESDLEMREYFASLFGVEPDGPSATNIRGGNVFDQSEAFHWLCEKLNENPEKWILCDLKQLNFVFYGLFSLASYTGLNAKRFFQEKIVPRLLPIQEYTSILLQHAPLDIHPSERWTDEAIRERFDFNQLIPLVDRNHICEHHEGTPSPTKYQCARSHNARLLHNFYHILRENKLQDIYNHYSEPIHCPCVEDRTDPSLPQVFVAKTMTRAQFDAVEQPFAYNNRHQGGPRRGPPPAAPAEEYSDDDDDESDDDFFTPRVEVFGGPHHVPQSNIVRFSDPLISYSAHDPSGPGPTARDVDPEPVFSHQTAAPMPREPISQQPPAANPSTPTVKEGEGVCIEFTNSDWSRPDVVYIYPTRDSLFFTRNNRDPQCYPIVKITCMSKKS